MIINSHFFSYERRFGGINRLYGEQSKNFQKAHICVVGLGGVGSWAVEALARTGIGRLTIIDLDNIAESNINRQLPALTREIGRPKVAVLAERITQINPECQVDIIEDFVDEQNIAEYLHENHDCIIDAIDQVNIKALMAVHCLQSNIPLVVSGGAGGQRHLAQIQLADLRDVTHDKLLANMRYLLRKKYGFSRNLKEKMHIPCVFSTEQIIVPQGEKECNLAPQGLSCAGYGASMLVTASFGLYLAHHAIEHILK